MGRRVIVLMLVLFACLGLVTGTVVARSTTDSTVIAHDWAFDAIEGLVTDRGIAEVIVPEEMNRTQGALLIARLLQHLSGEDHLQSRRFGLTQNVYLDNMIFNYNQRVTPDRALSESQVELLYRLVLEFEEELEILGYAIQDFSLLDGRYGPARLDANFRNQPLRYSEQALSAALKAGKAPSFAMDQGDVVEGGTVEPEEPSEPPQPRNLWTAHLFQAKNLPPSSSIVFQTEEEPEQEHPMFNLGGIEVSGGLRAAMADPEDEAEEGIAGYGISLRMGELALKTAVDLAVDPSLVPKTASTSVDLSLDWADLFTLSAGIRQRGLLLGETDVEDDEVLPFVTSLGLVVPINKGQLQFGVTQEWNRSLGQEGLGGMEDGSWAKNIAELGLSYDFDSGNSLHFNYRLIDFSDVGQGDSQAKAEAKFSIKF
ncbi:MAG: hypothetical protein GX101_06135 [Firmicutes bacterium]|jgi:hypothetical protein|nr:hypothetical protein [Bacillota bacterium]NLO66254.1 hypothetical protein [Bacillota bacterium]